LLWPSPHIRPMSSVSGIDGRMPKYKFGRNGPHLSHGFWAGSAPALAKGNAAPSMNASSTNATMFVMLDGRNPKVSDIRWDVNGESFPPCSVRARGSWVVPRMLVRVTSVVLRRKNAERLNSQGETLCRGIRGVRQTPGTSCNTGPTTQSSCRLQMDHSHRVDMWKENSQMAAKLNKLNKQTVSVFKTPPPTQSTIPSQLQLPTFKALLFPAT
jgi:hypothetical protein